MQKEFQVTVFEGGTIRVAVSGRSGREAVLALPTSRLLVKMVRVPAGEDAAAVATPALQAMSPFPDEPLTVSCETVRETAEGAVVLAAALPEGASDDIAEALDAQKLCVTRIDLLALGELRAIWGRFDATDGKRRLVRLTSADGVTLLVLDGDMPVAIRGVVESDDPAREEMLLLLEAEAFGGPKPLAETVEADVTKAAVEGIAARSADPSSLNALPASWREVLEETRFKKRLVRNLSVAVGLWLVVMGVLFGVPVAYGFLTDHQKDLSRQHARQYRQVSDKKKKVDVFKTYSDHGRGALEIMKAVSDRLPAGITLSGWDYDRAKGLRLSGEAETDTEVYDFKNAMEALAFGEDEEAPRVFATVTLGRLNMMRGKQRFDLELGFEASEEEE